MALPPPPRPQAMISVLSPLVLGSYDMAESALRLYRHDLRSDLAAAATDFGNLIAVANLANSAESTPTQMLFDELGTTDTAPMGTTYGATGTVSHRTANTILLGYG